MPRFKTEEDAQGWALHGSGTLLRGPAPLRLWRLAGQYTRCPRRHRPNNDASADDLLGLIALTSPYGDTSLSMSTAEVSSREHQVTYRVGGRCHGSGGVTKPKNQEEHIRGESSDWAVAASTFSHITQCQS